MEFPCNLIYEFDTPNDYEFDTPNDYEYIDTLKLCRQYLGLKCNKLDVVCKHLNIRLDHYHNALEDARACGQLFFKLKEKYNIEL